MHCIVGGEQPPEAAHYALSTFTRSRIVYPTLECPGDGTRLGIVNTLFIRLWEIRIFKCGSREVKSFTIHEG